ncbi:MAG: hydrolase, partial [Myxococcales bacterium]
MADRSPKNLLTAIAALAPLVRSHSDLIERERKLPQAALDPLIEAGVFRMCVPRSLGGLEVDVTTLLSAIEEVARADGSAGWCTMIGATSGLISGYLEPSIAREIYGDARGVTGGVFAPRGHARLQNDTYVASGRWPFASGVGHCNWLMGGCLVTDENGTAPSPPIARMLLFPSEDVVIHDTWDVAGLRGTGSHDIEVQELTVPVTRSVDLTTDRPLETGTLYRFPVFGLLALGI